MIQNVQKQMDQLLIRIKQEEQEKSLLLHSCCAPCSSYVLEYLSSYFHITDFFYNPNISPRDEYQKRTDEMKHLISSQSYQKQVTFLEGTYEPEAFFEKVKGMEKEPEGGKRCHICFEMRLRQAAKVGKNLGLDYFATTLTISPLKNAELINEIGQKIGEEEGIAYLPSDFKKKNGYKRSIELSHEYHLYRQNFCGCVFSKEAAKQGGKEYE